MIIFNFKTVSKVTLALAAVQCFATNALALEPFTIGHASKKDAKDGAGLVGSGVGIGLLNETQAAIVDKAVTQVLISRDNVPQFLDANDVSGIMSKIKASPNVTAGIGEFGGATLEIELDTSRLGRELAIENMKNTSNAEVSRMARETIGAAEHSDISAHVKLDMQAQPVAKPAVISEGNHEISNFEPHFETRTINVRNTGLADIEKQLASLSAKKVMVKSIRFKSVAANVAPKVVNKSLGYLGWASAGLGATRLATAAGRLVFNDDSRAPYVYEGSEKPSVLYRLYTDAPAAAYESQEAWKAYRAK